MHLNEIYLNGTDTECIINKFQSSIKQFLFIKLRKKMTFEKINFMLCPNYE